MLMNTVSQRSSRINATPPARCGKPQTRPPRSVYNTQIVDFKTRERKHRFLTPSAFSLVEISLSLALLSFSFVSLLGLMSSGITQFHKALDSTVTAQIAQRVLNDARQADFAALTDEKNLGTKKLPPGFNFRAPSVDAPAFRYFDEQGNEVQPAQGGEPTGSERLRVAYQVNVRVRPAAETPKASQNGALQLAQVTVQVAHLPGDSTLSIEEESGAQQNLFKHRHGVPVYTYAALVGRNE